MVRLKAEGKRAVHQENARFQFHDGSIKGEIELALDLGIGHFNSTMVRLKVKVLIIQ